jgi:DNA polymerase I-like protein with 3'-5' exonuclease and polymerase domains
MRTVFRDGRDPHRATAATITGKREEDVTPHERKLAKAVNFGFLFGMGAPRFREYAREGYGVELDDAAARRAREAFFATFPGIAAWHRKVAGLERERGSVVVRTALGRRKRFAAGKLAFNAALNIPVQGTAADGFKRAMIELHARLADIGGRGVLCVHDEYIAEVPQERAEAARELVVETMKRAMASVVTSVPIEVEARVSECWG